MDRRDSGALHAWVESAPRRVARHSTVAAEQSCRTFGDEAAGKIGCAVAFERIQRGSEHGKIVLGQRDLIAHAAVTAEGMGIADIRCQEGNL